MFRTGMIDPKCIEGKIDEHRSNKKHVGNRGNILWSSALYANGISTLNFVRQRL